MDYANTRPLQTAEQIVALPHDVYEPSAIRSACDAFRPYCTVQVRETNPTATCLALTPVTDHPEAVDEFLNYVLDLSVRSKIDSQNTTCLHTSSPSRPSANDDQQRPYGLYPFRYRVLDSLGELLVNEVGDYMLVPAGTARRVVEGRLSPADTLYKNLISRFFIHDSRSAKAWPLLSVRYRTKKSFLMNHIALHIVVITLRCDHQCLYCQVSSKTPDVPGLDMAEDDIPRCVDLAMHCSGPSLTLEIQGGEPLLAFDRVKSLVQRAKDAASTQGENLTVVLCTNLTHATDEVLCYCRDEGILISTSLDGPKHVHDHGRQCGHKSSYDLVVPRLERAIEVMGADRVSALATITRYSLAFAEEIVDEYLRRGLRTVFLRRISRFGRAHDNPGLADYSTEEFLQFYFRAIEYMLSHCLKGSEIAEAYASTLLAKLLTPFSTGYVNLQSPAGAGVNVLAYHYNGDVFSQDEGRMLAETGDLTFRLGNLRTDTPQQIVHNPNLIAMIRDTCAESLPGCADCAYQPYCGSDPVQTYKQQGTTAGHRPTNEQCRVNMAILDYLFRKLHEDNRSVQRILMAWARSISVGQVMREGVGTC